jgi:hypothetical protein
MSSQQPPKKKFKTSAKNPASNITSFKDLGLRFNDPKDTVIIHHSSSDGRKVQTSSTSVPTLREHVYTSVDGEGDWENFQYQDHEGEGVGRGVFQVKKGRVSKLQRRKLFASVRVRHLRRIQLS